MTCERCGKKIAPDTTVCPTCGTPTRFAQQGIPKPTSYGEYPSAEYGGYNDPQPLPTYEQGYATQQSFEEPLQSSYAPPHTTGYVPPFNPPPIYQSPTINVTVVNTFTAPSANKNNALLAEVLCSLFGLYGIGWLMAGETVTGIILLICSLLIIWPLAIAIAVLTLGFGIFFCDLPLTVVGIIINAILLNAALNRKTVQYGYTSTQAQQMSPRHIPSRHIPQ